MNPKSLTSTLVVAGIMLGGFGTSQVASAQTADDDVADDTTATVQDDADTDADTDADADTDGEKGARAEGRRGQRDGEGRRGHGGGCNQEAVAEAIGISVDELSAAREEGASLAEIAEANGVDPEVVADALIAELDAKLDAKVAEGRLTEDEAAERLADKSERIEDRVFGADDEGEAVSS